MSNGLCGCGCGEKTRIAPKTKTSRGEIKGQPQRFLHGHAARGSRGTPQERFWEKVNKTETCWIWTGAGAPAYGLFYLDGAQRPAHRVAYEWLVGPIPNGLQIDHLCRTPACVNPAHLEPVSLAENVRRGLSGVLTTHCPEGHEYTDDNTYRIPKTGAKQCRECKREADRRYRRRLAGENVPHLPHGPGRQRR